MMPVHSWENDTTAASQVSSVDLTTPHITEALIQLHMEQVEVMSLFHPEDRRMHGTKYLVVFKYLLHRN